MLTRRTLLALPLALLALLALPNPGFGQSAPGEAAKLEFFEKKVQPVLAKHCYNCHSANTKALGELRVDDRNGLLTGGKRGPAVVPGHADKSLLLAAVRRDGKLKMPPDSTLPGEDVAVLRQWVADGAAWPKVELPYALGKRSARYERLKAEHWAWQPLADVRPPAVKDAGWARSDADRFLLARLEAKGLRPVADADRRSLLRRVTFDLTGLPPTPDAIDAFLKDDAPDAFAKVVDRLLASPAFGERWGRHWLDVARYGESTGSARNLPLPHAWRYRDYVLDAFNRDMPFNQFVTEQIAGDLLPADSPRQRDARRIATGFLALGVKDVNQRFKVRFIMDNVDEQIDTVTRAFLGLTASCARCHDHKFDPIPAADYYALAGIFTSTDLCAGLRNKMGGGGLDYYDKALLLTLGAAEARADPRLDEKVADARAAFEKARAEFQAAAATPRGKALRARLKKLEAAYLALTDPAARGAVAYGVRDAQRVGDTELRVRGEAEKLGPVVPRGYLSLLDVPDAPPINPRQSGRLELARWLTSEQNPLTPRVLVNRVWHHLFGQGIVTSVDNFGVTGDTPSHPELLDHLARRFMQDGWSVKKLVRTLVLTRAYQLSADADPAAREVDPANRLVWRHGPRRLSAEELRDAMLAAAGDLSLAPPEGSPAQGLKVIEIRNDGAEAKRLLKEAAASTRRSVYLPLVRTLVPPALEVFDFAEQGMVTGNRAHTTVAPQALYLLNDPFVQRQARSLARRVLGQPDLDDAGRLGLAYQLTLARPATAAELERARRYLADYEAAARDARAAEPRAEAWGSFCQALFASAEFRYVR